MLISVKAEHGLQDFSAIIQVIPLLASWTKTKRQPVQWFIIIFKAGRILWQLQILKLGSVVSGSTN